MGIKRADCYMSLAVAALIFGAALDNWWIISFAAMAFAMVVPWGKTR